THVLDVVNCLNWADRHGVVLVGHSYGGLVIAGAVERAPGRLRHLVYLDALVPRSGDTWRTVAPDPALWAARDEVLAREGGFLIPHGGEADLRGWGVEEPALLGWVLARLTPHPAATSREPLFL